MCWVHELNILVSLMWRVCETHDKRVLRGRTTGPTAGFGAGGIWPLEPGQGQ